jgi:hypothetical protein
MEKDEEGVKCQKRGLNLPGRLLKWQASIHLVVISLEPGPARFDVNYGWRRAD